MTDSGGLDFNFIFAPGVSLEQQIGFETAGEFWSQQLADNATINIFVEMTDYLPENVLGGALPGIEENVSYEEFRYKLEQDITSDLDNLINENQQDDTDSFTAYFTGRHLQAGHKKKNGYEVADNEYMQMTRANAKALNIIDAHDSGFDGYIMMRNLDGVNDGALNNFSWNYDYSNNPIAGNQLDFVSVAIHEIGHTLGYISGLDKANWLADTVNLHYGHDKKYYPELEGAINNATPVDMMRFSEASNNKSGDGENWIDMSVGSDAYLSFTGSGGTPVAHFSTGTNKDLGGDGYQASHWKRTSDVVGIMDPALVAGHRREVTQLDIQLFDAIGWDRNTENSNSDLETLADKAKETLANKIGETLELEVTVEQMESHPVAAAKILAPDFVDENLNELDDRGEKLGDMIVNSGEAYEWGWARGNVGANSFWWGWARGNVGANSFWQSADESSLNALHDNMLWQTVEISNDDSSSNETSGSHTPDIIVVFDSNNQKDDKPKKDLSVDQEDDNPLDKPKKQHQKEHGNYLRSYYKGNDVNKDSQDSLLGDTLSKPLVGDLAS